MTNLVKALDVIIRTCELWKDYEEGKLSKEQIEQRVDAIMSDTTILYNESGKSNDPEIQKEYEEVMEHYARFKRWIKLDNV